MPHRPMITKAESLQKAWTLPAYLMWAAVWYAFFLFAVNVRVPTPLWEPVYLWVFAQVTLLEPATGDLGRNAALGVVLGVYLILGCVLWVAVEARQRPHVQSVWKRSGLAWAVFVITSMLVAFGVLSWL